MALAPSVVAPTVRQLATIVIPLAAVASQVVAVGLGAQSCRLEIYQKSTGLFLDLYVADRPVIVGVICRDRNVLVPDAYRAFDGNLAFYDTQGTVDPSYLGLGDRFQLVWLS